jgi:hypothetical protein
LEWDAGRRDAHATSPAKYKCIGFLGFRQGTSLYRFAGIEAVFSMFRKESELEFVLTDDKWSEVERGMKTRNTLEVYELVLIIDSVRFAL